MFCLIATVADALCMHPDHLGEHSTTRYIPSSHLALKNRKTSNKPPRAGRPLRSSISEILDRARSPSPCRFAHQPPAHQLEQFPAYGEKDGDWEEWKRNSDQVTVNDHDIDHCIRHCMHLICRDITDKDRKRNMEPKACRCCRRLPLLEETSSNQERISCLRLQDILAAQRAYEKTGHDETITLKLGPATALVKKMRSMGYLNLTKYLRASKQFTGDTTLHRAQYLAATRAANILISKLLNYLSITLSPLKNQTRTLTIAQLVKEMTETMRLDIFWWMSEWCFRNQVERSDNAMERARKLKGYFGMARRNWINETMSRGVKVLFERMEGVVEMVVAVLLWWSRMEFVSAEEGRCQNVVAEMIYGMESSASQKVGHSA